MLRPVHITAALAKKVHHFLWRLKQEGSEPLYSSITWWTLQRTVKSAQRVTGSGLPTLGDIYISRCKGKVSCISKAPSHPPHRLFSSLPSGRRLRSNRTSISRLRNRFYPDAVRPLNTTSPNVTANLFWLNALYILESTMLLLPHCWWGMLQFPHLPLTVQIGL